MLLHNPINTIKDLERPYAMFRNYQHCRKKMRRLCSDRRRTNGEIQTRWSSALEESGRSAGPWRTYEKVRQGYDPNRGLRNGAWRLLASAFDPRPQRVGRKSRVDDAQNLVIVQHIAERQERMEREKFSQFGHCVGVAQCSAQRTMHVVASAALATFRKGGKSGERQDFGAIADIDDVAMHFLCPTQG